MKALGITDFGGPEMLKILELPEPEPQPGEVLIRVEAAGVNPTDITLRSGKNETSLRADSSGPWVPGMDVAGEVIRTAEDVDDLQIGQRVSAIVVPNRTHGGYSERIAVPRASVLTVPKEMTSAEAATLPMNGLTALAILDSINQPAGNTLLVTGATGVLGSHLVALAAHQGLKVLAVGRPEDEEFLLGLGAETVMGRTGDLDDQVRTVVPDGIDALADLGNYGTDISGVLRQGGSFAAVRGAPDDLTEGVHLHQISVRDRIGELRLMKQLQEATTDGVIRPRLQEVVPAASAAEAHRAHEQPGRRGRIVLAF